MNDRLVVTPIIDEKRRGLLQKPLTLTEVSAQYREGDLNMNDLVAVSAIALWLNVLRSASKPRFWELNSRGAEAIGNSTSFLLKEGGLTEVSGSDLIQHESVVVFANSQFGTCSSGSRLDLPFVQVASVIDTNSREKILKPTSAKAVLIWEDQPELNYLNTDSVFSFPNLTLQATLLNQAVKEGRAEIKLQPINEGDKEIRIYNTAKYVYRF